MTTTQPVAAACAIVKVWCETCGGIGTIDETLGGISTSNPEAECPDCDGHGYNERRIESALASAEPVAWQARYRGISSAEWMDVSQYAGMELDPAKFEKRALYTHAQPAAKVEAPGYELSDAQLVTLLSEGLKPEEICGTAEVQHARVGELVRWFVRLATGSANPKWARSHAFELAYFVATSAGNRHIDINKVREDGFKEGAMVSPQDRGSLERIGFLQPMPAPTPASDHPECSGDPASCPENEGRGCCKPNPVKTSASVPDGFYLASFKRKDCSGAMLWWGPDNAGYTPDIEQAGIYTEITPGYHDSDHTVPVPVSFLDGCRIRRTLDPGDSKNRAFWSAADLRAAITANQEGTTP